MSSSTAQYYDTRFNNFSYHALGLICDFYAEEPQQIVQVFALINKRSNDVIINHARAMWKRVISSFFASSGLGEFKKKKEDDDDDNDKTYSYDTYHEFVTLASRFSFNPNNSLLSNKYSKTADAKAAFNKRLKAENEVFEKFNHPFVEIEDCGKGNTNDNSSSSSSTVDFKFRCPMLAQNLQLLSEQTKSGLPVLFCDVCQKKVFTIGRSKYLVGDENSDVPSVQEQMEDAAKHGRCVRIDEDNDTLLWMFHQRSPSQIGSGGFNEGAQAVNIGFVVSNDEQAEFVRSFFRRMPAAQNPRTRRYGGGGSLATPKRAKYTVPVFISKNEFLVHDHTTRPNSWRLRLVEHSFDSEAGKHEVDDGSDERQSALGKKHAPSGGGWSYLVIFDGVKIGKGAIDTPLLALQTTGRVHRFVGPAAAIRSDKNNEVKTEDDAAENDTKQQESDVAIAIPFSLPDHQLYTPTQFFDQLWNKLEKEIINEFKMPAGIMGQVALIRDVRTSGNTRPLDEKMKPEDKKKPEPGFFSRLFGLS